MALMVEGDDLAVEAGEVGRVVVVAEGKVAVEHVTIEMPQEMHVLRESRNTINTCLTQLQFEGHRQIIVPPQ